MLANKQLIPKIILNREFAWTREIIQNRKLWILAFYFIFFFLLASHKFFRTFDVISRTFDKILRL